MGVSRCERRHPPTSHLRGELIVQLHSTMCHLRGLLHLRLSSMAMAKECFMEALSIDVKNYEAFRELVDGEMLSPSEGKLSP